MLTLSALTLPRLSRIVSLTVNGNDVAPTGSGGGGSSPQFAAGMVSTGPLVVWTIVVATEYDQFQATIVPGAVEVLPSKVQLRLLPLSPSTQVSEPLVPETPKLAVATDGGATGTIDSVADLDTPA